MGSNRFRILEVDASLTTRAAMFGLLNEPDFDVSFSTSATQALSQLEQGPFDLLIADELLADNTGAWLASVAREHGLLGRTSVILLTNCATWAGTPWATVLHKPVDARQVFTTVRALLPSTRRWPANV